MADSSKSFANYCIRGLKADKKKIKKFLDNSLMLVTSLNPRIGRLKFVSKPDFFKSGKEAKLLLIGDFLIKNHTQKPIKIKNIINPNTIKKFIFSYYF